MNVTGELLDLQRLTDQRRETDLLVSVCSAIEGMKLLWKKSHWDYYVWCTCHSWRTLICNKVSEEGGKAIKLHCIIRQEVLCTKHLKYDHDMKLVVKTINLFALRPCATASLNSFYSTFRLNLEML